MNGITQSKVILYLAAIFLAGVVAGYVFARQKTVSAPRPDEMAGQIRSRLESRLSLTPDQVAKINPLIDQTCAELQKVAVCSVQQTADVFGKFHKQIAEFLTPRQKEELEKFQQERRESWKKKCQRWTNSPTDGETRRRRPPSAEKQSSAEEEFHNTIEVFK